MKILLIGGSPREKARTRGVVKAVEKELKLKGVEVLTIDVGINKLPFYTGGEADDRNPEVQQLRSWADQVDGYFVCTPEYHSSVSGALKNALDFISYRQCKGKPAAIAAVAGGGKGGINALNHLRSIFRALYCLVLPQQIVIDPVAFDEQNTLVGNEVIVRLNEIIDELVNLCTALEKRS